MKLEEFLANCTPESEAVALVGSLASLAPAFTFKQTKNGAAYLDAYDQAQNRRTRIIVRPDEPRVTLSVFRGELLMFSAEFKEAPALVIAAAANAAIVA